MYYQHNKNQANNNYFYKLNNVFYTSNKNILNN